MPRPKGYDPDKLGEQFRDVFWIKGYEGTSLSDLVSATGVKSGSLHAGFGQKPDLFAAALKAYDSVFMSAMDVEGFGFARLNNYIDRLFARVISDPDRKGCFVVASASEVDRHTASNREAIVSRIKRMKDYIDEAFYEEGRAEDAGAAAFLGSVIAMLALARCGMDVELLDAIKDEAKRALNRLI